MVGSICDTFCGTAGGGRGGVVVFDVFAAPVVGVVGVGGKGRFGAVGDDDAGPGAPPERFRGIGGGGCAAVF